MIVPKNTINKKNSTKIIGKAFVYLRPFLKPRNIIILLIAYRNLLNSCIKTAKRIYYQNRINQGKQSSNKSVWNAVNDILGAHSQRSETWKIRTEEAIITDPAEVAQEFNKYFSWIKIG